MIRLRIGFLEVYKTDRLVFGEKSEDPARIPTLCFTTQALETCAKTLFADLLPCSFQQNEIVRIRLLDRRDRFVGDSCSESGAKGKLCHASAPYASLASSVPVTGPLRLWALG